MCWPGVQAIHGGTAAESVWIPHKQTLGSDLEQVNAGRTQLQGSSASLKIVQ